MALTTAESRWGTYFTRRFSADSLPRRDDIERHLGAIRQAVRAGLLDGRNMDENVLAAAIRRTRHVAPP
jgi:hypothetical protein